MISGNVPVTDEHTHINICKKKTCIASRLSYKFTSREGNKHGCTETSANPAIMPTDTNFFYGHAISRHYGKQHERGEGLNKTEVDMGGEKK